jgi:hypothetical protein
MMCAEAENAESETIQEIGTPAKEVMLWAAKKAGLWDSWCFWKSQCSREAIEATFNLEHWTLTQTIMWAATRDRVVVTLVCDINSPLLGTDSDREREFHREGLPDFAAGLLEQRRLTFRDWDEWRGEVEQRIRGYVIPAFGTPNAAKEDDREDRQICSRECRGLLLRGEQDELPRLIRKKDAADPRASRREAFTDVTVLRSSVLRAFPAPGEIAQPGEAVKSAEPAPVRAKRGRKPWLPDIRRAVDAIGYENLPQKARTKYDMTVRMMRHLAGLAETDTEITVHDDTFRQAFKVVDAEHAANPE